MQANLTPEKIELMDRYLDHQLSDQEAKAFEMELEQKPGMMGELREYTIFRNNLSYITTPRDYGEVNRAWQKYRNPRSKIVKLLRVITWLLVILTLFIGYLIFSENRLFEVFFHSFKE
ncbi:MAG TPA: hypothetical protein VIR29_08430 [Anseongella sp.]